MSFSFNFLSENPAAEGALASGRKYVCIKMDISNWQITQIPVFSVYINTKNIFQKENKTKALFT